MEKTRIQVYAEPILKRRIELAAAKRDMPVTEYCLAAIVQRLAEDEVLEARQVVIDVEREQTEALVPTLRALHDSILIRRHGTLIDTDTTLEKVRRERGDELLNSLR
ncbi:hypothetical protein [Promineifilum sp.]|uniref:hypothetical protein n=1 Tax=Promineifilum sp. TaxID=2664178 RepID=UPI0035AFE05B